MDKWQKVRLGEVCDYINDRISLTDISIRNYISTENMLPEKAGITTASGLPTTSQVCGFQKGDILVSNIRPYFRKIWCANESGGCSNDVLIFRTKKIYFYKFLYYVLSNNAFFEYAMSTSKGTKMPRGDKVALMNYLVPLPPLPEQKRIAAILSALDDKIELNNRMNKNLEAQAQAIFKSWFVDFEPWGGVMPEDWKEGELGEIAIITMGQSPKGDTYNEDGNGTVFYQGRAEFGTRFPTRRLFTTAPNRMANENDILLSVRAPVGDYNIATERCCIGRGLAAIKPLGQSYAYCVCLMDELQSKFNQFNGEGTVFGSINKDSLNSLSIIIPTDKIFLEFEKIVSPFNNQIRFNYDNIQTLSTLRDTLLPKLMSGEIDLKEEE